MRFNHPEPAAAKNRIYPVFIPFAGCALRCVFCAQERQTGLKELSGPALEEKVLAELESLSGIESSSNQLPVELAFYGGTFTALPRSTMMKWLELACRLKEQGQIASIRCSTRPDAFTPQLLDELKGMGLETVELGIQSFSDKALLASRRAYSGETAYRACEMVKQSGLRLGIQLMPGMPGMTEDDFRRDIELTAELAPAMARLYPCLVLRGTILAQLWEAGDFTPWSLEQAFRLLPDALLALWLKGINVIRMGLAPQPGMESAILAGPAHPALGQCLRSRALYGYIKSKLSAGVEKNLTLLAPRRFQGEFFGHRGELKPGYAKLGLLPENVIWHDEAHFILKSADTR